MKHLVGIEGGPRFKTLSKLFGQYYIQFILTNQGGAYGQYLYIVPFTLDFIKTRKIAASLRGKFRTKTRKTHIISPFSVPAGRHKRVFSPLFLGLR